MSDDDEVKNSIREMLQHALGSAAKAAQAVKGRQPGDARSKLEAQDDILALLNETAKQYQVPNPYKAGDLVTPRRNNILKWAGEPHIVLHAIPNGHMRPEMLATDYGGDKNDLATSSPNGYPFCNIRVAKIMSGHTIGVFWGEAWMFEPWTPDMKPEVEDEDGGVTMEIRAIDLDELQAKLSGEKPNKSKAH